MSVESLFYQLKQSLESKATIVTFRLFALLSIILTSCLPNSAENTTQIPQELIKTIAGSIITDPDGVLHALPDDPYEGSTYPAPADGPITHFSCANGTISEVGYEGPYAGPLRMFSGPFELEFQSDGGLRSGVTLDPNFAWDKTSIPTEFLGEEYTVWGLKCRDGWWFRLLPEIIPTTGT